jgi:adenylylsulfate kinase
MKTIWLFGPSGAGKTTIGKELQHQLKERGRKAVLVDGDELRDTICKDLGFSYHDRLQQATRASYMAKAINEGGAWAIVCLITPFKEFRDRAKNIVPDTTMIYLESSLEVRIKRDPKGLYAKALSGELSSKLTGYDGTFDEPESGTCCYNTETHVKEKIAEGIISLVVGGEYMGGTGI